MKRFRWFALLGLTIAALPSIASAQERGTVTGQVVDAATQRPLVGVQVVVVGTNVGTITNQSGQYVLSNVAAGEQEVRASYIGYSRATELVNITPGGTTTANFALEQAVLELEGVIATATGQTQRRREVGNTVATIDVADVELAPIQNFSQLLQGRSAGVTVLQSAGTTGAGARIRIRGSNSISLSNEPLLVVDGIRVENSPSSIAVDLAGQSISRLNDINPEDIESVEILKGPAASAMYGTAAANGVIQITTRRGVAGDARWNVYTEVGGLEDVTDYPFNYQQVGTLPDGGLVHCSILNQASGACTPTELRAFSPLKTNSPFRTGERFTVGLNVTGGGDRVQYYVAGETETEDGIFQNNHLDRVNLRANLFAQIRDDLDVSVQTGYVRSETRMPLNDNAVEGIVSSGLLGRAVDDDNGGYYAYPLEHRYAFEIFQNIDRILGSLNTTWRPLDWLSINGTAGLDLLNRDDSDGIAPNIFSLSQDPDYAMGYRFVYAGTIRTYTGRANAVANFQLNNDVESTTTFGGEYLQDRFQRVDAGGYNLAPGTGALGGLSERFSVDETDRLTRTLSIMGSQLFGWRDRVFLTGAIRGDRNSNFGSEFGFQWYPSFSGSWVVGEEEWFPISSMLNDFRLRAAWGRSGLLPTFRSADPYFNPVIATIQDASVPAITIGGPGNADLKPEKSSELELGFEAGLFNNRLGLDVTYYNKKTTDALVQRRLAPSLGSSTTQWVNLGEVSNSGIELQLDTRVIQLDNFQWNALVNFSTNDNKLIDLGEGIEDIIFGIGGDSQRHTEGFPLGSFFYRSLVDWGDADDNGIITLDEVELSDDPEFLGRPFPTREISFATDFTFYNRFRVSALFDHKGGHQLFNSTEEFRCDAFQSCRGMNDASAPLWEQARAVARVAGTIDGFVEDADFTKLRELSLTIGGLEDFVRWAGISGASDVSLTISGRNLKTWTDYTGLDPEMNSGGQSNFSSFEFLGQPPVRSWSLRLNVGF